jgi:hypothetical protein
METDETYFLNSKKYIEEKIYNARIEIASINDSFLSAFVEHGKEIIQKASEKLSDSTFTKNPTTRKIYHRNSLLYLDLLGQQIETLRLAEATRNDSRWKILEYFTSETAKQLGLNPMPIPIFGSTYYATGSFVYSSYRLDVTRHLYQVSVDINDSALFWPLLAHELVHCKLSQIDITNLEKKIKECRLIDETHQRRVKESLCDCIAARIFGPSFLLAFITMSWAFGPSAEEYPNQDFRIKLILETLSKSGWSLPREFTNIININEKLSEKEEIHPLFDNIIEMAIKSTTKNIDNSFLKFDLFSSASRTSLDVIFNAGWLEFIKDPEKIRDISEKIREYLERRAGSS